MSEGKQNPLFGPAGNSDSFTKTHKSSALAPLWLREMGLDCYEYQCGRGVHVGRDTAEKIGASAREHKIAMSLHSPYFINLSSCDPERIEKNLGYILSAAQVASWIGADRMVVHCGGLSGLERAQALENTIAGLKSALKALEDERLSNVRLCIETMGKRNTVGTVEEVAQICATDERLLPCVDFGHVNSRTGGGLRTLQDFERVLETLERQIGHERLEIMHIHFSKIEYNQSGEVRHLTLEDEEYGPDHRLMLDAVRKWRLSPRIICESAGKQAEDAKEMKNYFCKI